MSIRNYTYTGGPQQVTLPAGNYIMECWGGASFPQAPALNIGKGGYSKGNITLTAATTVFIYVGGTAYATTNGGNTATFNRVVSKGGWNGGGDGNNNNAASFAITNVRGGGGGSTDIRIGGNTLAHRVMVAGGGAGWYQASLGAHPQNTCNGGGQTSGFSGSGNAIGRPATQTAPGDLPVLTGYTATPTQPVGWTHGWNGGRDRLAVTPNPRWVGAGTFGQGGGISLWATAAQGFGRAESHGFLNNGPNTYCGGGGGWFGGAAGNSASAGSGFVNGMNQGGQHLLNAEAAPYTFTSGINSKHGEAGFTDAPYGPWPANTPYGDAIVYRPGFVRISDLGTPPVGPPTVVPPPPIIGPPTTDPDVAPPTSNMRFGMTNLTGVRFNGMELTRVTYNGVVVFQR